MFWKILGASIGFMILWVGFYVLTPPVSTIDSFLVIHFGSATMGGINMGQIVQRTFGMFMAFFVMGVIGLIIYIGAASQTDENDTGMLGLEDAAD